MKREYRHPCGAFVMVSPTTTDGVVQVDNIRVPDEHRGRGVATSLMRDVCAAADCERLTLRLTVHEGRDSPPDDVLVRWYGSLGFVGTWESMSRRPLASV